MLCLRTKTLRDTDSGIEGGRCCRKDLKGNRVREQHGAGVKEEQGRNGEAEDSWDPVRYSSAIMVGTMIFSSAARVQ